MIYCEGDVTISLVTSYWIIDVVFALSHSSLNMHLKAHRSSASHLQGQRINIVSTSIFPVTRIPSWCFPIYNSRQFFALYHYISEWKISVCHSTGVISGFLHFDYVIQFYMIADVAPCEILQRSERGRMVHKFINAVAVKRSTVGGAEGAKLIDVVSELR